MRAYIAMFVPDKNNSYSVLFPDLPGCATQGDNFETAFEAAIEAMECHLGGLHKDGEPVPPPSSMERAKQLGVDMFEGEPLPEGVVYQLVPAPDLPPKKAEPVRVSVSLAPQILARIDEQAEELGLSRSALIALASRDYVNRMQQ